MCQVPFTEHHWVCDAFSSLKQMIKYLYRKSLLIQDKEEKLGALLITHMLYTIPHFFNDFTTRIKLQYAKEFTADIVVAQLL